MTPRKSPSPSPPAGLPGHRCIPFGPRIPIAFADNSAGFDADPPWLMVPVGDNGTRWLQLRTRGNAPATLPDVRNKQVLDGPGGVVCAEAWIKDNRLFIKGLLSRRTSLSVRQDDAWLELTISIKARRVVPIFVHLVEHGPLRRARTTTAETTEIVEAANRILQPQANVSIDIRSSRPLTYETIGERLGRTVEVTNDRRSEWRVVTRHAVAAPAPAMNLFVVRAYEDTRGEAADQRELADTDLATGNCIFEDHVVGGRIDVSGAGATLAHEVGHRLGLADETVNRGYLMYESAPSGTRLASSHIDLMNPPGRPVAINPFT